MVTPSAADQGSPTAEDRFDWHPVYRGRTVAAVRNELSRELARDQRAYALVLEGAEQDENAALASVIELEKRWGGFDMDWATADAALLAGIVTEFERERERRRELFPFADYRAAIAGSAGTTGPSSRRPNVGGSPLGSKSRLLWLVAAVLIAVLVVAVALS